MHRPSSSEQFTPRSYLSKRQSGRFHHLLSLFQMPNLFLSSQKPPRSQNPTPNPISLKRVNFEISSLSSRVLPLEVTTKPAENSTVANYHYENSSDFLSTRDQIEDPKVIESPMIHSHRVLKPQNSVRLKDCNNDFDLKSSLIKQIKRSTSACWSRNKSPSNSRKNTIGSPQDYIKVTSQITPGQVESSNTPIKPSLVHIRPFSLL